MEFGPDELYEASEQYLGEAIPKAPPEALEQAADAAAKAAIISLKKHARGQLRLDILKRDFRIVMQRLNGTYE